jgi:hypothetical protein
MAISKPRNRVVLFRLTQEEYAQVQQACAEESARSVSDFARARILGQATESPALEAVQLKLEQLTRAVEALTRTSTASSRQESGTSSGSGYGPTSYLAKSGD